MWSNCLGCRSKRSISAVMAPNISALCRIGAVNVAWARSLGPRASATEPTLLDVSSARISSCFDILRRLAVSYINIFFGNRFF